MDALTLMILHLRRGIRGCPRRVPWMANCNEEDPQRNYISGLTERVD